MLSILTTLALVASPQAVDPVGSLQRLDIPTNPTGDVTIQVELGGKPATLVMERHSLRAPDFKLFGTTPTGQPIELPAPAPRTWRGEIAGWADSLVTASITDEGLTAVVVDYQNELEWQIQPAAGYPSNVYSVALSTELDDPQGICGTPSVIGGGTTGGTSSATRGTGLQLCEMAVDADFEFYQRNGNSVQATLDDMERIFNRVDTIYVRDVDVTFQLTAVVIRTTSADPYTTNNPSNLLGEFRAEWSNNFNGVRRDLAHLFTGKNIQGGVIGIAFLGVVCSQGNGYGLSESRFTNGLISRTGLTAHEVGHNFNSNHCDGNGDCRIMCSGLGGCQGDVTRFGTSSANGIRNYAVSRACLLDLSPALSIPVMDDFPTTSLNRDIWISFQGTEITTAGTNEPSAPNSLRMNATNANNQFDDRLITNKILLATEQNVQVQFAAQHVGVPAGGTLRVEILDVNNDWLLLGELTSDGSNQTQYTTYTFDIPAGAYHDEAQVRLETGVDNTSQNWYIDDFLVDDGACGSIQSYCVAAPNSMTFFGADLQIGGSASIAANDMVFNVSGCPTNSFGIYLYGDQQTQAPLGDGFLCVNGNPIYRLAIIQNNVNGESSYNLDQNNLSPGSTINPGDRINFQLWFRDSTPGGANTSQGVSVVFCP